MSSLNFAGSISSYLRIPNNNNLFFGTGDFTIEWYQYFFSTNPLYPRVFQIGLATSTANVSIGVSLEGGTFYIWRNNATAYPVSTIRDTTYTNKWTHFAICKSSGTIKIFMNGALMGSLADTTNYTNTTGYDLTIGNEHTPLADSSFKGYMLYFSWIKGVAKYASNFTVSNTYPAITSNTVLFIGGSGFTGTLGNTVINNNVSTIASLPPGFVVSNYMPQLPAKIIMSPLYTNNAQVYYKPGSLASCGVGSVRNSSTKKRKI